MDYVIYREDNTIVESGSGSEEDLKKIELAQGHSIAFGHLAMLGDTKKKFIGGKVVDTGEPLIPLTYANQRRYAYPPIGDQLDSLWKYLRASGAGSDPIIATMLEGIEAVKDRYPKSD